MLVTGYLLHGFVRLQEGNYTREVIGAEDNGHPRILKDKFQAFCRSSELMRIFFQFKKSEENLQCIQFGRNAG